MRNDRITYKIVEQSATRVFSINNETGAITLKRSLDREKEQRYIFKVEALGSGVFSRSSTAQIVFDVKVRAFPLFPVSVFILSKLYRYFTEKRESNSKVFVFVQDVNDNSPYFTQSVYHCSVSRDSPPGTAIIKIHADDADAGSFGEVFYMLFLDPTGLLKIDFATGQIRLASYIAHRHFDDDYEAFIH